MSMIIDRRLNDRKKSAVNRQRFMRRYKKQLRKSIADLVEKRSITDMEKGGDVSIPSRDIHEPSFHHGRGGDREIVHPGNRKFNAGDRLPRPEGQGQGQGDGEPSEGGEGQDDFTFSLSREEFMNLFFDDLELPRMARLALGDLHDIKRRRAGYTPSGTPSNLAVARSMRNALARRIALGMPIRRELEELEAAGAPEEDLEELRERLRRLPYLEDIDLRYRHSVADPQPISRAVMFCLMDVSASMSREKKDLAKRFFSLLYMFLSRKYETVELVFIRHTSDAEEVDEHTFFYDTKTGGTVVLSALQLMLDIIGERYSPTGWNIYGAQVSDGDAFGADTEKSRALLQNKLLPLTRYFAYIEVPDNEERVTSLMATYAQIDDERFAMNSVMDRAHVYPVLRELFAREGT